MKWHIRKTNGEVFGPVELTTLQAWAADGRIAPEDSLSQDQETWTPAPDVPELAMEWLVQFADGSTYGPIHLLALRDPLREGSITADATLQHRGDGEPRLAGEALLPPLLDFTVKLGEEIGGLHDRIESLNDEIGKLRSQSSAGADSPPAPDKPPTPPEGKAFADAYDDLSRNYDVLLEQLHMKSEELERALEARAQAERHAEEHVRQLEEMVRRDQEDAQKVRTRLAELENKHFDLVKSYREMNDRFIRMRQPPPGKVDS